MRVLVSGFEPFGGECVNPSQRVAEAVGEEAVGHVALPVVFAEAWPKLAAAIEERDPEVVVALGQATGATAVTLEQIAVNLDSADDPDEAGEQPEDRPIVPGAPLAYRSGLPVRALVAALRSAGTPAAVSRSAGGHLCNHVFFRLCHLAATARPALVTGFVHLPCLPEQALDRKRPSMPLEAQAAAVRRVIASL